MLSMLHNIYKHCLCLSFACIFFATSTLDAAPPLTPGKKIDLSYQSSSSQHYYSKITINPDANYASNPTCDTNLIGMLAIDDTGGLHICNGSLWKSSTSPWDQSNNGKLIYPKDFATAQVVIGSDTIVPNLFHNPDLIKFYLSQPNNPGSNRIAFTPSDQNGNAGIEIYTEGSPLAPSSSSSYIDFLVGEQVRPLNSPWDARIEYYYNDPSSSGLKFIGQRDGKPNPPNEHPELKLYSNGNVDFGSDENAPPLAPLPPRDPNRKVKVYGDTKVGGKIILNYAGSDRTLKLRFVQDGYYAIYAP